MERKRKQGRGAGRTGKGLAREDLTEKMTFETSLGASRQVSEEREFQARKQQVQGTANRPMCLELRDKFKITEEVKKSRRALGTTLTKDLKWVLGITGNLWSI